MAIDDQKRQEIGLRFAEAEVIEEVLKDWDLCGALERAAVRLSEVADVKFSEAHEFVRGTIRRHVMEMPFRTDPPVTTEVTPPERGNDGVPPVSPAADGNAPIDDDIPF